MTAAPLLGQSHLVTWLEVYYLTLIQVGSPMKVLSLVCQKGGTTKTTTGMNLAVEATACGLEVALIDLDPQVSACDWKDLRGDKSPVVAATPVPHLDRALKAAA